MPTHFVAGNGALFAQIDGPNTEPFYLGCHEIGDIDAPAGDIELIYCPDASGPNRFRVVGSIVGAAGAITTTITTDVTDELDQLEQINCEVNIFVHMVKSGRRDLFTNFDRTFVLTNARITSRGLSGLTSRTPDDNTRAERTYDFSAETLLTLFEQTVSRQSISDTGDIEDITFCNDQQCRTDEDVAKDACETGYAVSNINSGSPPGVASVLATTDGSTWTASAADPFASGEVINGIDCFELSRDDVRIVVARGTTDAGNPAEIAYSDDDGDTWTLVDVGSVNGQFAPTRFSLFSLNRNNSWLTTNDGYVYYSGDACATWTAQESGSITANAINTIRFMDADVGWFGGASNAIARTVDGGETWSSITGPAARASDAVTVIEVLDRNRVWVGYDSGHLYFTLDGGTNWTLRSFSGSGAGDVRDIKFLDDALGYLIHDLSATGTINWTIDGGFTWSTLTTPANSGLHALAICDQWNFYVAGEGNAATGFIAKGTV